MKNQYYNFIREKVDESASHLLGVRQTLYLIREALLYDQAGVIAAADALQMTIDHLDELSERQDDILKEANCRFEQSEAVSV